MVTVKAHENNSGSPVDVKPIVGILGYFHTGKSTLINCFLRDYAALTGKGRVTTKLPILYRYPDKNTVQERNISKYSDGNYGPYVTVNCDCELLKRIKLLDTPGFSADAEDGSDGQILPHMDYALFLIPNRMLTLAEKQKILALSENKIPFSVIMNCIYGRREEKWIPNHPVNQDICRENSAWLRSANLEFIVPIKGQLILPVNALFYWSQLSAFHKSLCYIDRPDSVQKHIEGLFAEENIDCSSESISEQSCVPDLVLHMRHMFG